MVNKPRIKGTTELSERELQDAIGELLNVLGYTWDHFRPARTKHGWVTPLSGHKGAPDLRMVGSRLLFAELKSAKGNLSPEQEGWIDRLRGVGAEVYVWRPEDWWSGEVERVLVEARPPGPIRLQ